MTTNSLKSTYRTLVLASSLGIVTLTASQTASAITSKNITYTVDNQGYEGY